MNTTPVTQPVPPVVGEAMQSAVKGEAYFAIRSDAHSVKEPEQSKSTSSRVTSSNPSVQRIPTSDEARKALPLYTFQFDYFPDAWLAVVGVAVAGNNQHNPGQPLRWAREKSTDQMNTAFRHQFDYGSGIKKDTDGQYHLAKAIWRLMAQLQLDIEKERT